MDFDVNMNQNEINDLWFCPFLSLSLSRLCDHVFVHLFACRRQFYSKDADLIETDTYTRKMASNFVSFL